MNRVGSRRINMKSNTPDATASQVDSDPLPLCLTCLEKNSTEAHFCTQCGAPMTSYACSGPFEYTRAQGHLCREAAERPRRLLVVVGVWLIFAPIAGVGWLMLALGRGAEVVGLVEGLAMAAIATGILWRSTRSYLLRDRLVPRK